MESRGAPPSPDKLLQDPDRDAGTLVGNEGEHDSIEGTAVLKLTDHAVILGHLLCAHAGDDLWWRAGASVTMLMVKMVTVMMMLTMMVTVIMMLTMMVQH